MLTKLDDRFPILEVADNCIISKMGDVTIGLELEKPEIFTVGAAGYDTLQETCVKAMKLLPEGTVVHFQDVYLKDRYQSTELPADASFLQKASEQFFDQRPFMRHTSRVFLTRRPAGRRAVRSATSGLLRRTLVPADTLDEHAIQAFENVIRQFSRILSDGGWAKVRRIPTEELVSSPKQAGVVEQYCYLLSEKDIPVVREIDLKDRLRIGDQECLLFTLADPEHLPGKCSPRMAYAKYSSERTKLPVGLASGLGLLLPFNHIFNQYIVISNQAKTLKKLETKQHRLQSLAKYSRSNAVSQEAIGTFLTDAVAQQLQAVKLHCNVMAWSDDPEELKEIRSGIAAAMAGIDAIAHQETIGAPQLWWSGIPGNAGDLPDNECFDTFLEVACCFLAFETNYKSSKSSFGIRLGDRLTGKPVHVDLDVEPKDEGLISNGNLFVCSGSGGGKSYFMNHLCRSYHGLGMHIVIVDVGHSYQVLCKLLGGYYFTYEESNPLRFNPFYIGRGEVFDTEKKESIKSLLLALWKKSDEEQYRSEYVALSNALQAYYDGLRKRPEVFPCFDTFYEFMAGEYTGILREQGVKAKEFDIENFLYVVRPYYQGGEFDFLLNAQENLDLLSERFIVFELDNIKDNVILFGVLTLVIMQVFLAKMRKLRGVRKMIVIEEAWKAIANTGMADNIQYWVRTLRKFMGKLALVSQEIEDMINSPIIKSAIINNSDCKILLDQSKFQNRFDDIQSLLGLSDKQKAEVLSINKGHDPGRVYKDCWIGLGPTHSMVYRLETSWEEYLAYTSDQGEKVRIEAYAEKYGSFQRGIEVLAEELRAKAKTSY